MRAVVDATAVRANTYGDDDMTNDTPVQTEDVIPVRSRISWAAVGAGSLLALATFFLLNLLGSAIGLSINDNVSGRSLAIGAVVWAVLVTAAALFLGGFIASQLTTGENKVEGILYGLLVWGLVFGMLMFLATRATSAGLSAMVGMANASSNAAQASGSTWEDMARQSGVPQNEIDRMRSNIPNATARANDAANDPATRQQIEENATRAAWYSFLGTLISMVAAALGGYVGAGPTLRLFTVRVRPTGAAFDRRDAFVRT
jgi:hypothetical protein